MDRPNKIRVMCQYKFAMEETVIARRIAEFNHERMAQEYIDWANEKYTLHTFWSPELDQKERGEG